MPTSGNRDRGSLVAASRPRMQVARVRSRVAVGRFNRLARILGLGLSVSKLVYISLNQVFNR